jgi:hypothetical protein
MLVAASRIIAPDFDWSGFMGSLLDGAPKNWTREELRPHDFTRAEHGITITVLIEEPTNLALADQLLFFRLSIFFLFFLPLVFFACESDLRP